MNLIQGEMILVPKGNYPVVKGMNLFIKGKQGQRF